MFTNTQFCLPASSLKSKELNLKNAKQRVNFFQDAFISGHEKKNEAIRHLNHLVSQLDSSTDLSPLDWIDDVTQIEQYCYTHLQRTCTKFQNYLARRKQQQAREYFPTASHAFEFLTKVTPVKFVDGAWLYSVLEQADLQAHQDLILTYLEELGLGDPMANHVCMYQDLLRQHGLERFIEPLSPIYYEQAAVQLALAHVGVDDLAWVIGFNLAYEQLPLHLLISNYELQELGIDPQYFNVHITIDNLHNGHAKRSIDAFYQGLSTAKDQAIYIKRVKQGYLLNDIGKSSTQIIAELDLEQFVLQVFQDKARVGQFIHNDKCQFAGKTINQWLSDPDQIQDFLNILIEKKWIIQNEAVENSRFWHMIDQPNGRMFGVFNATEKQIIKDWIQGARLSTRLKPTHLEHSTAQTSKQLKTNEDEFELGQLKKSIQQSNDLKHQLSLLKPYLAPNLHATATGLWATQHYTRLLFPAHRI